MTSGYNSGFSLLGVLVALFVLVTGIIATTQLMARTTKAMSVSRNEFIATNLAREGLELVRATRDSNWFKRDAAIRWTDHPHQDTDPTLDGICDDELITDRRFIIDSDSAIGTVLDLDLTSAQLYLVNGKYTHISTPGQDTPFSRVISVNCSERESDPARITITSQVTWIENGQDKDVTLMTRLYDWYIF